MVNGLMPQTNTTINKVTDTCCPTCLRRLTCVGRERQVERGRDRERRPPTHPCYELHIHTKHYNLLAYSKHFNDDVASAMTFK